MCKLGALCRASCAMARASEDEGAENSNADDADSGSPFSGNPFRRALGRDCQSPLCCPLSRLHDAAGKPLPDAKRKTHGTARERLQPEPARVHIDVEPAPSS